MKSSSDFRNILLKEDQYKANSKAYADKLKYKKKIIIWGTGNGGDLVYKFLEEYGVINKVEFFVDNNETRWGTNKNGILVLSPNEVLQKVRGKTDMNIIVASQYLVEIKNQLISLGVDQDIIDIRGFGLAKDYFDFQEETPFNIIHSNFESYEKVYDYLSDQRSKDVFLGILNSKISLDNSYLEGIADPTIEQYFDKEIIQLTKSEVFCDCGSFDGDTLETFIKLTEGNYKKYIAIEADEDTYRKLNHKIIGNKYKDVETYNVACWSEKTVLKFQPSQTAGHISEMGEISVAADTLDNLVKERVTFLKMDIEGAEEMALTGASQIIKKYNPVLAICLYHSLEDYYKLPLLIKHLYPGYKLFVRHYTDMVDAETVCYAIPE